MPGASATIILLISAQAWLRSSPSGRSAASSIASSISDFLSCDQLTLPAGLIALPANVGCSMDSGSWKSLNQPTFGQIATLRFGTPQNFVYSVSCGTLRKFSLKPSFSNSVWATVAVCLPGSAFVAMVRMFAGPSYLPSAVTGTPSFLASSMYFFASSGSPSGFCIQSNSVKPCSPSDSSWPGMPGGM